MWIKLVEMQRSHENLAAKAAASEGLEAKRAARQLSNWAVGQHGWLGWLGSGGVFFFRWLGFVEL